MGRWGVNFQDVASVAGLKPGSLANALRIVLRPEPGDAMTVGLRTGDRDYGLRIEGDWIRPAAACPRTWT